MLEKLVARSPSRRWGGEFVLRRGDRGRDKREGVREGDNEGEACQLPGREESEGRLRE